MTQARQGRARVSAKAGASERAGRRFEAGEVGPRKDAGRSRGIRGALFARVPGSEVVALPEGAWRGAPRRFARISGKGTAGARSSGG